MPTLTWTLDLRAGRASSISDFGVYVIIVNGRERWLVEFTMFTASSAGGSVLRFPEESFPTLDDAIDACGQHAAACARWAPPAPGLRDDAAS
jgi:hypothetical protein